MGTKNIRYNLLAITLLIGLAVWFLPHPPTITSQSWHLFAIFVATIFAIIIQPLPMGAVTIISITVCVLTHTLTIREALTGFAHPIVWLVVAAFFISRAFINTGLGKRIAYYFITKLGKSTLGISYGLVFTEFLLSPLIPSVTARGGGIIYPVAQSLAQELAKGDNAEVVKAKKTGAFLMHVCFQANVISSAIFLTAMAGNPIAVNTAGLMGIEISWFDWAMVAIVPGIVNLIFLPLYIYYVSPPGIKVSEHAVAIAKDRLKEMGPVNSKEGIMLFTFGLLITCWIFGKFIGIDSTTTALLGVSIILLTGLLTWEDAIAEKGAWRTFIWFSVLITMSGLLQKTGIIQWIGESVTSFIFKDYLAISLIVLMVFYFYAHYFFASATAHITVMYGTFLVVLLHYQVPGMVAALFLAFISILSGGLTHYGIGTAPIFFGSGYAHIKEWWRVGLLTSILNLVVWGAIGGIWWKILGLY